MHEVQALTRLGEPLTTARMRWMLGFQRRLVRRWEWLTAIPKDGCLPHTSQTAAMTRIPQTSNGRNREESVAVSRSRRQSAEGAADGRPSGTLYDPSCDDDPRRPDRRRPASGDLRLRLG